MSCPSKTAVELQKLTTLRHQPNENEVGRKLMYLAARGAQTNRDSDRWASIKCTYIADLSVQILSMGNPQNRRSPQSKKEITEKSKGILRQFLQLHRRCAFSDCPDFGLFILG